MVGHSFGGIREGGVERVGTVEEIVVVGVGDEFFCQDCYLLIQQLLFLDDGGAEGLVEVHSKTHDFGQG